MVKRKYSEILNPLKTKNKNQFPNIYNVSVTESENLIIDLFDNMSIHKKIKKESQIIKYTGGPNSIYVQFIKK